MKLQLLALLLLAVATSLVMTSCMPKPGNMPGMSGPGGMPSPGGSGMFPRP